jgi:UDP-N-acetylglucosamine--N-acetylmuramyl-(pentapeptide) pyrophosphoryl-undecaprenol N-acetylglucosamine transferase
MRPLKFIISGGGTGGHIFPAIAIADELRSRYQDCDILFIGAKDRMEMEKVPRAGYPIKGLWISGIQRSLSPKNLIFPLKLLSSLAKARKIIRKYKPDVVIGVGGYASAAVLRMAITANIPTLIQEQNSFPGITNKWLAPKVNTICVAFDGLQKYFPKDKIVLTGNPVRNKVVNIAGKREKGYAFFNLKPDKPTLLITGGSLGARSVNQNILKGIDDLVAAGMQILWQTGRPFYKEAEMGTKNLEDVKVHEFIYEMDLAYAVADMLVARAGAITVSELCLVQKPAILVPLPTAAEDHQTKNAMALVDKNAAILIPDKDAGELLVNEVIALMNDQERREAIQKNLKPLGQTNATGLIVDQVLKLVSK